jgi:hypothetical protein
LILLLAEKSVGEESKHLPKLQKTAIISECIGGRSPSSEKSLGLECDRPVGLVCGGKEIAFIRKVLVLEYDRPIGSVCGRTAIAIIRKVSGVGMRSPTLG